MEPLITFPYWGNYSIAFKTLFEEIGLKVIPPEKTNFKTIIEGSKLAPEMFCFPMKVTIGSYLEAIKNGANTIFIVQNVGGSCRQRYYGRIQEKILKEVGYKINFLDFKTRPLDIYLKLKKISNASFFRILRAAIFFFKKLWLIEKIEKLAQYYRPKEIEKGLTDKILNEGYLKIEKVKKKNFSKTKEEILKKFKEIKIDKNKNNLKIGLIGEIYTVTDPTVNFDIERKLGQEGIEVHREMSLNYHIKKGVFFWKSWLMQRRIKPYLASSVGGHGRDAIDEMLKYIKEGFDGIIHLLPFGCMPEITVRPILEKLHKESGIPFLSLSLDEQVAEAGINTRLEAFIDVVKNYHKNKF